MSTAVEILEFSRDLIKTGWTRGAWAEDRDERSVDTNDPSACAFCLIGAVERAIHVLKPQNGTRHNVIRALTKNLPNAFMHPVEFNDAQHSEESVLDLIDRTIDSLKEKD